MINSGRFQLLEIGKCVYDQMFLCAQNMLHLQSAMQSTCTWTRKF